MTREKDIERYLVKQVKDAGGIAYKWVSPGKRGVPDRIIVMPHKVVFVELKATGKKPTKQQWLIHGSLRYLGQLVWVIDSREQVDEFIRIFTD